jgi:outer membrane protein assembly factor BamB
MTILRSAAALLLATAFTLGCRHQQAAAPPPPSQASELARLGFSQRWLTRLPLSHNEKISRYAVVGDMIVIIQTPSNLVTALSARDGSARWRTVVGETTDELFEPVLIGDRVFINSGNRVYVLAADTGRHIGLADLESPVAEGPSVSGNLLIFGSLSGKVFAHSAQTGHSAWTMNMPASIIVKPVVDGGNVFVTDSRGDYKMFTTTGELAWYGRALARISARPIVNSNGVFVASEDQTLRALNRVNGHDRWTYRATAPLREAPTALGASIYLPLPTGDLASIDPLNGSELWKLPGSPIPLELNGQKLLLYTGRSLQLVDNQTGKTLSRAPIAPVMEILHGPDNSLVLIAANGEVQRLDVQ